MTMPSLPPDQVVAFTFLGLVVILLVARGCGWVAKRVGQPEVVGFIVAGILLGPSLLGRKTFAWDDPWSLLACDRSLPEGGAPSITACFFPAQSRAQLGMIGQIALVLFMFLVGVALDPSRLAGKAKGIASVGIGVVALPIAAGFLVGPALYSARFVGGWGGDTQPSKLAFALMVGAMLSVTAFPVAARILQEKGLADSTMGSVGVAAAAIVTVLMFVAVGVARGVATDQPTSSHLVRVLGIVVFFAVMALVVRPLLTKTVTLANGQLSSGELMIVMAVVFGSAYAADRIGINTIVGGFVAGAVMPHRNALVEILGSRLNDFVNNVLLPVFLAVSGLATDMTTLGWAWIPGLVLFLVAGIATKWIGGLVFGKVGGLSWAESNVLGVLMNCRGLLVLVVALIALNAGVITPQMQVAGVLMALVSTAMTGPLVDWALRKTGTAPVAATTPAAA
jgi:Kef-type K+ transport system membrane component KefB